MPKVVLREPNASSCDWEEDSGGYPYIVVARKRIFT
jgi:hypothetical protein